MSNSDKTGEYCVKRLSINNLNDVTTLHTAVYGKMPPADFFLKKYGTDHTGIAYIGFIAYNKQMLPISYYGVIPCFMSCDSKSILAAQSADTMTHPEYRNRGLFVELAQQTLELCRNEGIRIVFGFPNQNSLPGFIHKLKWQTTETMDCFIIPVKAIPMERLSVKIPFLKGSYSIYTNWVLKKYLVPQQGTSNSVLSDGYDGVFRDAHYLEYKKYSATQVIHIEGAAIWMKINKGLLIGDISGVTDNNFDALMNKLLCYNITGKYKFH